MVWVRVGDAARLALDLLELWDLVLLEDGPDCLEAVLLLGLLQQHVLEFWQVEQDLPLVPFLGQHLVVLEILERGLVDPPALVCLEGEDPLAQRPDLEEELEESWDRGLVDGPQLARVEFVNVAQRLLGTGLGLLWMETTG